MFKESPKPEVEEKETQTDEKPIDVKEPVKISDFDRAPEPTILYEHDGQQESE